METTNRKLEANRENAKLGGVKTERGKMKVRFNARKHGVLSNLISKYEEGIYKHYLEQLFAEYKPQSFVEQVLVERIAVCYLRLYRSGKAEQEFMQSKFDPSVIDSALHQIEGGYVSTLGYEDVGHLNTVYLRYETTIENRMYKAIHELERLRRMRNGESVQAPVMLDVEHGGFVSQKDS